jgi:hypothetical protein
MVAVSTRPSLSKETTSDGLQMPTMHISRVTKTVMDLVYQTLDEAVSLEQDKHVIINLLLEYFGITSL